MEQSLQYAQWFRQVSPYINQHRAKVFVIGLIDRALEEPYFQRIVHDLALLKSLGIKLVVVHGARMHIDHALEAEDLQSQYHLGWRVTDAPTLQVIKKVIGGIRLKFEAAFTQGSVNLPNSGAYTEVISGNFLIAKPMGIKEGVDFCFTGKLREIKEASIRNLLDQGNIVLISPLGHSATGETFNLASADLMAEVAAKLHADKLVIYSEALHKFGIDEGVRELTVKECDQLSQAKKMTDIHRETLSVASRACHAGVPRVHFIHYEEDGALINELFTRDGVGMLVTNEIFEEIVPAAIADVGGILELIEPLEADGVLVRRSRELLEQEIEQFFVSKRDGIIIGCAALYPYAESKQGEIACLTVHPDYRKNRRAHKLLQRIERRAKEIGITRLFALTTEAIHWFVEQGFVVAAVDDLPVKKKETYNWQRNSKILMKDL